MTGEPWLRTFHTFHCSIILTSHGNDTTKAMHSNRSTQKSNSRAPRGCLKSSWGFQTFLPFHWYRNFLVGLNQSKFSIQVFKVRPTFSHFKSHFKQFSIHEMSIRFLQRSFFVNFTGNSFCNLYFRVQNLSVSFFKQLQEQIHVDQVFV